MSIHLAILRRELTAWLYGPTLYVYCAAIAGLSAVCMFWLSGFIESDEAALDHCFFRWQPWIFAITAPMIGYRTWSEESRCGMFEVLGTLPVRWESIILVKAWAGGFVVGLALLCTLPACLTVVWLGDPDPGMIISGYLGSLLCGTAFAVISQAVCACMRCSTASLVCSAAICLLLTMSGLTRVADVIRGTFPGWEWVTQMLAAVSILPKFQAFAEGRVEWAGVGGYLWLIACSVLVTYLALMDTRSKGARL